MKRWMAILLLVTTVASASHLSDLMHRYKRAPESQKYRIMNQIKLEIARLNKKRQHKAIRALYKMNGSHNRSASRKHAHTHATRSHAHASARSHAHTHAMDALSHAASHHPSPADVMNGFMGGGSGHTGGSGSTSSGHSSGSHDSGGSHSGGGSSSESGGGMSMPSMPSMPGGF